METDSVKPGKRRSVKISLDALVILWLRRLNNDEIDKRTDWEPINEIPQIFYFHKYSIKPFFPRPFRNRRRERRSALRHIKFFAFNQFRGGSKKYRSEVFPSVSTAPRAELTANKLLASFQKAPKLSGYLRGHAFYLLRLSGPPRSPAARK